LSGDLGMALFFMVAEEVIGAVASARRQAQIGTSMSGADQAGGRALAFRCCHPSGDLGS
jgi:hypothetical protein